MAGIVPDLMEASSILLAVGLLARPLGGYMARVLEGERTILSPILVPVERAVYRVAGVDPEREQRWTGYAVAVLLFAIVSILVLYAMQRLQGQLPLNPTGLPGVAPDLAFNTAISFVTNTNWQAYPGESTMGHVTQAGGLVVQNFVSAATGLAVAVALTRGLARRSHSTIGNFWVDLTRSTLYILLPIALVAAVVLLSQGVVQSWSGPVSAATLDGHAQMIAVGPFAGQEAIKEVGTNGGGPLNANSAHPFENPNGLTNWFENALLLLIPFALTNAFGRLVGDQRQGWVLFAAMMAILVVAIGVAGFAELGGNRLIPGTVSQVAGNLEGKEVRFGAFASGGFAAATTGTSTGAVDSMHTSFVPIAGLVPMALMLLGEVSPGGVGAGLYGILTFVILAVFIAGLMVGRTPEYLGKKIESFEVKMVLLAVLATATSILLFTAIGSVTPDGLAGPSTAGPHGFSEILYAFTSQSANNGSCFCGLSANSGFYNLTGGVALFVGRFATIVPVLAIAGSMVGKRSVAPSLGTFPTTGPLFTGLLVATIVIVGALTFFPALALGPIVEQLTLIGGAAG
jgi:K+-transporting ATPase ATPase A chain